MPSQGKYREMVSGSNCTDYQTRRLNIRYRENPGAESRFAYALNSTAVATRAVVAIIENFQQRDGSVKIPKVLVKYMDGLEVIKRK